jgi:tubulin beta
MGIKYWEVVCDEHGIGGSGEYCGDNDLHFDRIIVLYYEVRRRRVGTALVSNSPKIHRRED